MKDQIKFYLGDLAPKFWETVEKNGTSPSTEIRRCLKAHLHATAPARKQPFTVIGFYPNNDQIFAHHVTANTWQEAIEDARKDSDCPISVVSVIRGSIDVADNLTTVTEY